MHTYTTNDTVWITGASSGLGFYTAEAFRHAGFTTVSGARSFTDGARPDVRSWQMRLDVTDDTSVSAFVSRALESTGGPDILVLCAGVLCLGACEKYTLEEMKTVLDTNFLGQARLIRAVLPLMRERGHGRIICYSSINGLLGIPYQGIYTASKHALEGYCESLAAETRPFGIEIMLVEPGDHRGGSIKYRPHSTGMSDPGPYKKPYENTVTAISHDEEHGSDPARLGRIIAKTVQRRRLPLRKCIASPLQHLAVLLHRVMRSGHFNRLIALFYGAHKAA